MQAQGLRAPVTTLTKFHQSTHQRLYIMKEDPPPEPRRWEEDGGLMDSGVSIGGLDYSTSGPNHGSVIVGMLKVGPKNLFVMDANNRQLQVTPLCVLDFYIHESFQRRGYGKRLFDFMMTMENCTAASLAYDKPSPKLLSFVKKYYGLSEFLPQNNNFILFREYGLEQIAADATFIGRKMRHIAG
ncbi:touch receptor neuron protein Mec-17-domain-containing protein [Polychytrium aggregatum]|uniref:touch receptor neuron protein Mec-17-domain-containing protein n=1 Tax=Polychytrium aggregatum TaxID=110093 RepID=UPI0022FDDE66|nr:touch receptor neuron protein Mec-17-domain-containing protein [Polychytrium aggregatum]KAI9199396.1 touch receptor neuron protein Mec-17-domain-containing protein [Polychytrium aggregatum]